ncbi:MAG: rhomboid family intramembrane serine protease [Salinivirgaceae bacterium]|jgi:membrane associated rhomboid family serine protease|nr:rhomboid family intramembrane serine protease [Salinivirgaceae bacterium]
MQFNRGSILGNLPPVIKNLLIINVLVFVADYILQKMGIDLTNMLALHNIASPHFMPFQFVTYMFMHGGIGHIFFNMFALVVFGRMLETVWGPKRFLIYYFVTGIGAAGLHSFVNYLSLSDLQAQIIAFTNTPSPETLLSLVRDNISHPAAWVNDFLSAYSVNPNNASHINKGIQLANDIYAFQLNIPTVGASGAVFGVLLAFGMLFPNMQLMLLFPPIPIKAKYLVIIYGGIEFFAAILPQQGDNVAHLAHLGGMIFGFLLIKYWNSKGFGNYQQF